jgi:hypothetical protein
MIEEQQYRIINWPLDPDWEPDEPLPRYLRSDQHLELFLNHLWESGRRLVAVIDAGRVRTSPFDRVQREGKRYPFTYEPDHLLLVTERR